MDKQRSEAARTLGRISTPKKAAAARENGKKGGRPRKGTEDYGYMEKAARQAAESPDCPISDEDFAAVMSLSTDFSYSGED